MFDDARSRRVIILAHCLLNQNAISDGTADLPSQFTELLDLLTCNHIGIIQLPCPELLCLGLDRGDCDGAKRPVLDENSRIRDLIEENGNIAILRQRVKELVLQILGYHRHGFEVVGIVGVNRSPSCGIETTSSCGKEMPGKGVFMELFSETITAQGLAIPMAGVKTSQKETSVETIRRMVNPA
jgi:predicted secreted protein